jgi:hypothetical protein
VIGGLKNGKCNLGFPIGRKGTANFVKFFPAGRKKGKNPVDDPLGYVLALKCRLLEDGGARQGCFEDRKLTLEGG